MIDEDADLRAVLSTMGPATLADLKRMAFDDDPTAFYGALARRPDLAALTHQLADSGSDAVARLRRAIRDVVI
jgi:hypothetical protein